MRPSVRGRSVEYANWLTVPDRTQPPSRSGNGATSVPPPAKLTRSGARARAGGPWPGRPQEFAARLREEQPPEPEGCAYGASLPVVKIGRIAGQYCG